MEDLAEDEGPEWRTGTVVDEFNAVYRVLAPDTKSHRGFSPVEVDDMLVSTAAVLMGAGIDKEAQEMAQLAEMARRRRAGETVNWMDLDPMFAGPAAG